MLLSHASTSSHNKAKYILPRKIDHYQGAGSVYHLFTKGVEPKYCGVKLPIHTVQSECHEVVFHTKCLQSTKPSALLNCGGVSRCLFKKILREIISLKSDYRDVSQVYQTLHLSSVLCQYMALFVNFSHCLPPLILSLSIENQTL